MIIYITNDRRLPGRQSYTWNEYELNGGIVTKYKCYRRKNFDGHENEWVKGRRADISWSVDDPNMPEWLRKHLP